MKSDVTYEQINGTIGSLLRLWAAIERQALRGREMQGRATTSGKYQEKYARQSTSLPQSCWQQRSPHGEIDQGIDIAIAPHNAACHAAVDNKPAAFLPCIDLQVRHDTVCGNSSSSGSARVAFLNGLNCQHGGPLQRGAAIDLVTLFRPMGSHYSYGRRSGNVSIGVHDLEGCPCSSEINTTEFWRSSPLSTAGRS